jgi:hypothetical protein
MAILGVFLFCVRAIAGDQLPAEVAINKEAGRGGHLIVKLRVGSGEEVPFLVDTGAPITVLDKSFERMLDERLLTVELRSSLGVQQSGMHAAPKLYLQDVPLRTDSYMLTFAFNHGWARRAGIKGILGMDCLRHYCVQLDFQAGKMRFLDPNTLDRANLGKAYLVEPSQKGQRFPRMLANARQNGAVPVIRHTGLLGGTNTPALIDTGANLDGTVDRGALKGHYFARFVHFLIPFRSVRIGKCDWDDQTYRKLRISTADKSEPVFAATEILGLRFLARHLVTFDFPRTTMYLKQTSVGPLSASRPPTQIVLTSPSKIE